MRVAEVDRPMAQEAASFKARFGLPYADSCAAALTKKLNGSLVTSDKDFRKVETEVAITWI